MPRIYHRTDQAAANHSVYQSNAVVDNSGILKEIATNTKNINLNVDTVEVSVDALEVLQAQTNTTLASILVDTDAADSSLNTIEAQSVLTASRLNNIQNKISANVDGTGDTLGQINSNILTKNGEIESSLNSLISANHTDLVALEASLTSMEGKQDSILSKNTEIETTANAIQAAVEGTLTVGSHAVTNAGTFAVQSTVAAALPAGTNAIGKLAANSGVDIGDVDVTSISAGTNRIGMVGLKANEAADGSGTERFVLCDAAGHLQVDVLSGGGSTDVSALATHAKQDTIIGHLDGVEGKLDAIETTNNACQVLLGTIDADTNAIKTAVEILDNAISGNEMQVDIVSSALPSGAATQTTLASILAKNTEIETTNNANQVLLGTIDSDTDAIKTATEAIENAVHVDDAAYTLGTHSVMMMGGFAGTQAVGANDAGALAMTTTGFLKIVNPMTTTQLDDGKSVSAGASTTSSVLNVTHVPTGRITFIMDPAVISVGDIQIDSVQYSMDGTLYLQLYTENLSSRDATGHKLLQVKDFFAPHFRIHFTNQSGGSNETNLDIWAIY